MKIIISVLLIGGLFYSSIHAASNEKILVQDTLLFMIKDQVFSLSDLEELQSALEDFDCMYPDAFLPEHFDLIVRKFDKRILDRNYLVKNSDSKKTTVYLNEFLRFLKIALYSKEQSVAVTTELKKAIHLSAKSRNCSMKYFNGDELAGNLELALIVEVFFRSRNVLDSARSITKKERGNILKSLTSLSRSITNQITHTQFEINPSVE